MRYYTVLLLLLYAAGVIAAQPTTGQSVPVCPEQTGVQAAGRGFGPGGIILTSFDRSALWAFELDSGRRYPLPETTPCGRNCRLSPDRRWILYFNTLTNAFNRMRLNGAQRSLVTEYAADVEWWSQDTFLIWTPGLQAYLRRADTDERVYLNADGVVAVQPGGTWGVVVEQGENGFTRALINLELRGMEASGISDGRVVLGPDRSSFNALAWSPNGAHLAYAAPTLDETGSAIGTELYLIAPGDPQPTQITNLIAQYGMTRINGLASGELSWSPDSTRIAYWVMTLERAAPPDAPLPPADAAVIHVLDITTGEDRIYCAFSTTEHTPNPPRLIWSPDGQYLAFAGNLIGDNRSSYLLLALDVNTGILSELSDGVYPAVGQPDVVAWGLPPA
jgi:hypothetical protein